MLRVGLTGGLGSGKSTVARMLETLGAHVVSADDLARAMMQPGEEVFARIVAHFGAEVVQSNGELDRAVLARLAFADGRVAELNAIVHPAVLARQTEIADELGQSDPAAILVVESALLFETEHAGAEGWRRRFDQVVLVTAEDTLKVARYVARASESWSSTEEELAAEARRRLAEQMSDEEKEPRADFLLENNGSIEDLERQVNVLWRNLSRQAHYVRPSGA